MMPKFYKKKPIVIQAVQWKGDNQTDMLKFCERCFIKGEKNNLIVVTLEGDMTASVGDYIIRGIQGEFYPCKPDIFELTYETVI